MALDPQLLPEPPSLVRVQRGGWRGWAWWREGRLATAEIDLDRLLGLALPDLREQLSLAAGPELDPAEVDLLAPAEGQEVWAAGVTFRRSRQARMEEAVDKDIYARVYESERPELFFKSAGWRAVPSGAEVGIRSDSTWNVPEPELAVLSNAAGDVVGYCCANDMSSRSIEGENPLYLPQAKVYDRSCSLGPALVPVWEVEVAGATITMTIERAVREVFSGQASLHELVRDPAAMVSVLHSSYPLPAGAWLLTGTSLVPPPPYTAEEGDVVRISVGRLGTLVNRLVRVRHTGATAPPKLERPPPATPGEGREGGLRSLS